MVFKRRGFGSILVGLSLALLVSIARANDGAPVLSMPVDCFIGVDCWVQNLVDMDGSDDYRDPFCGKAAYDTHKGTDIRVADLASLDRGVDIRAMAPGRVVGSRNKMADRLITEAAGFAAVRGVECGNGVMLDHGNGWTTQYCHMRQGSIAVSNGDRVERGTKLGTMGISGHTTFPHLHFTVWRGKTVIDPVTGRAQMQGCNPAAGIENSLFDEASSGQIKGASSAIVATGFADATVDIISVLEGTRKPQPGKKSAVFYAKFINLRKGDITEVVLRGGDEVIARKRSEPHTGAKAVWVVNASRKSGLKKGPAYAGEAQLLRDGKVIDRKVIPLLWNKALHNKNG